MPDFATCPQDNGERYILRYRDDRDATRIYGYSDDRAVISGWIVKAMENPQWSKCRVTDRERKMGKKSA